MLRFVEGVHINRKAVYRVLKLKGWFVNQRVMTPRPRVHGLKSRAQRSRPALGNGRDSGAVRH